MIRLVLGLWWGCVTLAVSFFMMILILGLAQAENCGGLPYPEIKRCHERNMAAMQADLDRHYERQADISRQNARDNRRFLQDFMRDTQVPLVPDPHTYPQYR